MLTGHRYRVLIYFAALVLCLSVCFAFAEPPASIHPVILSQPEPYATADDQPVTRLLYYTAPGRSTFMPATSAKLVAEKAASERPASADTVLEQLSLRADRSHHLVRTLFPSRHRLKLVKPHQGEPLSASASSQPGSSTGANE